MQYVYPMVVGQEEGQFTMSFPLFEESHSWTPDEDQVYEMGLDCILVTIDRRIRDKEDIPKPRRVKRGEVGVSLPAVVATKVALYQAMRDQKVSNVELAKRLDVTELIVRRMLEIFRSTKMEKLEKALAELGKKVAVDVIAA